MWYTHVCTVLCADCEQPMLPEDHPWNNNICIPCEQRRVEKANRQYTPEEWAAAMAIAMTFGLPVPKKPLE